MLLPHPQETVGVYAYHSRFLREGERAKHEWLSCQRQLTTLPEEGTLSVLNNLIQRLCYRNSLKAVDHSTVLRMILFLIQQSSQETTALRLNVLIFFFFY